MAIRYRKLTTNDLDTFIRLRLCQLREEGATEEGDLTPALRDYYERHMANDTFFSWIAVDGDAIIATSGISVVEKPPYFACVNGRIGLLSSMYTDPRYRRQGIARALLAKVTQEAADRGCCAVHITASDMGVPLYKSFGFTQNPNFYQLKLAPSGSTDPAGII